MIGKNVLKSALYGVCAVALLAVGQNAATAGESGPDKSFVAFTGADFKEDSWFAYIGGIYALSGLGTDSFAVRGFIGGGEFDYKPAARMLFPGGKVNADTFTADLQLGYRMYSGDLQFGVYAGVNYWDIDQNFKPTTPNFAMLQPTAKATGDKTGFKVDAEINRSGADDHIYVDLRGSYSTAFDTYWSRGQLGYNMGMVTIGPEGALLGNDDYDQTRIGGFAKFSFGYVNVSTSVGWADVSGSGNSAGDSVYGSVGLSTSF